MATTFTLAIALVSCGGETESPTTTTEAPTSTPAVQGEPLEKTAQALEAGSYCYRTETPKVQAIAELLVEPDGSVSGTLDATVTDQENSYFTSYQKNFAGILEGETLDTAITTKIEYDVQNTQEQWTLNENLLTSDRDFSLKRVDCEEIIALKAAEKEAPKPPAATPAVPKPNTPPPASQKPTPAPPKTTAGAPIQVQFASGATEKTFSGNLNPGQTQVYLLNAQEGQDMFVQIVSKTGAANFDVEVDNGEFIEAELVDYLDFTLPFSGQYIITTRATAPNTSYDITVRIK